LPAWETYNFYDIVNIFNDALHNNWSVRIFDTVEKLSQGRYAFVLFRLRGSFLLGFQDIFGQLKEEFEKLNAGNKPLGGRGDRTGRLIR
jgi:hypothetical protein